LAAYGSADATATPSSLASLKPIMAFTFLMLAYPGCPGKEANGSSCNKFTAADIISDANLI